MKKFLIVLFAVVAIAALVWWLFVREKPFTATYQETKIERADLSVSVSATGTVEPVSQVEVGTQVSGIVSRLYVDYNSNVKKGQVIAELDKTNLLSELASKKSNLASAKSEYDYQLKNYERQKTLHEQHLIAEAEYETAYNTYLRAKNSYEIAKNDVAKAQTNLGYATIYSPIDGVVLSKSVEEGQTVASSFNTPTLFVIANDLTNMQVVANVDEADIGNVQMGQKVVFSVDAFPNESFQGQVTQVRQEATTSKNVVTYEVVISAPNPDLKLKPGLTANVTIYTMERQNVLCVATKALRFNPSAEENTAGPNDTIIDCKGRHKLWTRKGHVFTAHPVKIGISSGNKTEILSGMKEGEAVIMSVDNGRMPGEKAKGDASSQKTEKSPFMPSRPGGRRSR